MGVKTVNNSNKLRRYLCVGIVFFLLQILNYNLDQCEDFAGISLQFYPLALPMFSALLVIYRFDAWPILAIFFMYCLYFHPLSSIFTFSAQLLAALISQTFYFAATRQRGQASFGRSKLTAQRIGWLVCCNAVLFTLFNHWIQPSPASGPGNALFTLQTFINLQWLMNACLTGIPFFYLIFRSVQNPGWCRLYFRQVQSSIRSGPPVYYQVIWLCLLIGIMFCLISREDNILIFTEYSLLWLLPVILWGAICIGHSLISPVWAIMLILLSHFTNNYIVYTDTNLYLHSVAIVSTMVFIFSITIVLAGVLAVRNRRYLKRLRQLFRSESNTGLQNFQALKIDMRKYSAACLCYLRCTELNSLEQVHGMEFRFEFVKAISAYISDKIHDTGSIYYTPGQGLIVRFTMVPDMGDLYRFLNVFRFNWRGFELGLPCGVAYTAERSHLQNLSQAVKLLNTQSYISLLQGKPLGLDPHSPGDNIVSEAVIRHILQKAIDRQVFVLMAQPILSTMLVAQPVISTTGLTCYHEILIRMKMVDGKLIFPDTILPIAREAGLLPALDITVIEQTFRFMHSRWQSDPESHFSINLTPESLNKSDFIDNVLILFKKYNVSPERIIFEVIETDMIDNANVIEALRTLRRVGSKIAIDDFGTGFSSYSRLRILEADILKIDGSFIRNIIDDPFSQCAVKSFCEVAKLKNMEIVAEFVENKEIEQALIDIGIGWLQGYHIGKPVPVETLAFEKHTV
ncbi:sensor domain-containing phosphodiesterase [Kluyvera sp. CHPC 1.251]|uniref:sensor domain-containing phosphodiesterase n=1 Tax=Kluyvera sp. CHPC 1.251 TaxID=2995175 RepID=UPI002FD7E515